MPTSIKRPESEHEREIQDEGHTNIHALSLRFVLVGIKSFPVLNVRLPHTDLQLSCTKIPLISNENETVNYQIHLLALSLGPGIQARAHARACYN